MTMTPPRLTVLLANFNHAQFLSESIPALLRHPEIPAEVIVVDDASTDDSVRVLERLTASDPRVQVLRNPKNRGVVANLDRLLRMATGEYVYSAAADDLVLPGFFERSLELLARHPQAGLCSTLTWMMDAEGRRRRVLPAPHVSREAVYLPPPRVREVLRSVGSWFQGNTVIHRRLALMEVGGYRGDLESFADAFAAQLSALRFGACFIPEPLTAWRMLPGTYSRRIFSDADRRSRMFSHAVELMEGQYRADFPPGFAAAWRREMEFYASREALARRRAARTGFGHFVAMAEWLVRSAALAPSIPPHVLRRLLYRRVPWLRS
ncbi:MAG TPA: glycosyltransferase family 2 protein [Candidatus Limnocylindria bacterium]|nr:glycosyltransferase family 2 protein [Candidatus Limnocylindria bacterium]